MPKICGGDAGMAARTVAGVKRLPKICGGDVGMAARTVVGVKRLPELRGEVIRYHDGRRDSATL
ncbi:MAG: hypothetical protein ACOYH0_04255 [Saccharofermentanales bacterium]